MCKFAQFSTPHNDIAPPRSADLVLTFRNFHNWMKDGETHAVLAAVCRALIYAIAEFERAGFRLLRSSEASL
jgi:predicted methyltransferase